jgi:molybdopterin synthase catalytic subunit
MVEITHDAIDLQRVLGFVTNPESGAIDVFIGTTRNNAGGRGVLSLEYEAYEPMALKVMSQLEEEARSRWPLHKIAIVHRIGVVDPAEASVVVAVSSAHRKEAFEACRFLIDRLKQDVPIWKKEHYIDGAGEWSGVPAPKEGRTQGHVKNEE